MKLTRSTAGGLGSALLLTGIVPRATAQECIDVVWSEDVESYADGQNIITGAACYPNCSPGLNWEAWESEPEGALSDADAAFGNPGLAINIQGQRPLGVDNLTHTFHDLDIDSGTWLISGDLYVPSGTTGETYFKLFNRYVNDGSTHTDNWSTQVHIKGNDAILVSDYDGGTVDLQFDVWRRLETIISLDDDRQTIKYDGEIIHDGIKFWTTRGSILSLRALNLFGDDGDPVYWDNFRLCSISPEGACCFRSDPCIDAVTIHDCEALQDDAIFQGIGSVCGDCPFYGPDGWEIDDLLTNAPPFTWDGDTCDDFPGIPSNPDCEFFPEDCSECDLSPSQEQAWSFKIPWVGTWTFSTCGAADFDSQIYAGSAFCLADIGFNDDCTRLPGRMDSELAVVMASPFEVSITLEGAASGDCGLYTLSVGAPCPEIAIGADQEVLGPCADQDSDVENIGCNADPDDPLSIATFTGITCGQTFAGTVGNFVRQGGPRRDFDWFRLEIDTTSRITLDAIGNYPEVVLFLAHLNANPGSGEDECTDAGGVLAIDATPTCVESDGSRAAAQVSVMVGPGLYAPIVSTAFVDPALPVALGGVPCGSPYEMTVTCCSASGDVSGDGLVTFADIIVVLANWGGGPEGDANCDGSVSFQDLIVVLTDWS